MGAAGAFGLCHNAGTASSLWMWWCLWQYSALCFPQGPSESQRFWRKQRRFAQANVDGLHPLRGSPIVIASNCVLGGDLFRGCALVWWLQQNRPSVRCPHLCPHCGGTALDERPSGWRSKSCCAHTLVCSHHAGNIALAGGCGHGS